MANDPQPTGTVNRARPSELLAVCKNSLVKHLLAYITPAFQSTNEALFQSAEKAPSTDLQNRLLEAQRNLLNKKLAFTEAFSEQLAEGFAHMAESKPKPFEDQTKTQATEEDGEDGGLSLVGEDDLEESLAITDLVSKAEVRFTQQIYALNQRLTVLNRGRPVKNDSNPCGPLMIGKAIRHAASCLEINAEIKVMLYHRLDKLLQSKMHESYQEINDHLAAAGILPNIKLAARKSAASSAQPSANATDEAQAEIESGEAAGDTGGVQTAASAAGRPAARRSTPGSTDFFGRALQSTRGQSEATGLPGATELVASIRQMMASQAHSNGVQAAPGERFVAAPQPMVGSALSQLQMRSAGSQMTGRLSADEIKRSLTEALGTDPASGRPVVLTQNDSQTIDIIDLLYDHIQKEQVLHEPVQNLLHKMQVPMIRVAMQDQTFFEDADHPARQFFNTVADAGELWLEDDPENSKTFQTIDTTLDRVLKDYQGDSDVFKRLLGDLNKHISLLSRKATLAERRHVDAARGQEKLELAREQAHRLIVRLVKKYKPPKFVESILSQPWSDYLALIVLRHGDDSKQWKAALTVAKTLIFSVREGLDNNIRTSLRKRVPWLRDELTKGLSQVGYYEQDILVVLDNLQACYKWSLAPRKVEEVEPEPDDAPTELHTELAVTKVADSQNSPKTESEAKKTRKKRLKRSDLNEKERAMVAKLRLMAFGTWFELKLDGQEEFVKRKLSWYSPVTSRCLFVNNRGSIAEEIYLEELAQSMAAGRARVFQPSKKPLIDRAFSAIFGRLKKMTAQVSGKTARQT